MKGGRTFLLVVAGLLVLGLVIFLLWNGDKGDIGRPVTLRDGSTITLLSVSYGTNHAPVDGAKERFIQLLPKRLAQLFGFPALRSMQTKEPTLGICLRRVGGPPNPPWLEMSLVDENGFESPVPSFYSCDTKTPTGATLIDRAFTTFPRRGRTIRLRMSERGANWQRVELAEFTFANPVSGPWPEWKPEAFPVVRSDGDLELALTNVITGFSDFHDGQPAKRGDRVTTEARFRVRQNGKPSDGWSAESVEMSDETGNQLVQNSWSSSARDGNYVLSYSPSLWPDEPAWKMRFEFSRTAYGEFAPEELWTIKGIAIPDSNSVTQVSLSTNLMGVTVHLVGLRGEFGRYTNTSGAFSGSSLDITNSQLPKGMRLAVVKVTDNLGRNVESRGASRSDWQFGVGLRFPTNAQTVDVTVAVHKSRFVEYVVKPEVAKASKPGSTQAVRK